LLLDRRRVKFWQKWVFLGMAILMAAFLIFGYSGVLNGCSNKAGGQGANTAQSALKALQTKLAANPNDLATLSDLATTYQVRGNGDTQGSTAQKNDLTTAATYYERWLTAAKAATVKPTGQARAEMLTNLASVYTSLQQYSKAISIYTQLTTLDPKNPDYYAAWGEAAVSAGNKTAAFLAFGKYLQLSPTGTTADAIRTWINNNGGSAPSPKPSGSTTP
jgi:tetratricopeptide (TPR) repeat protein